MFTNVYIYIYILQENRSVYIYIYINKHTFKQSIYCIKAGE